MEQPAEQVSAGPAAAYSAVAAQQAAQALEHLEQPVELPRVSAGLAVGP
jgi:hypothetical protein